MNSTYLVLDLETTGLNPREDRIIELGCLLVTPEGPKVAESILVNPDRTLSPDITRITGITQEMVDSGVTIGEALTWLVERCGGAEVIVGHNILGFDWDFLMQEEARALFDLPWTIGHVRDTAAMFLAHRLQWPMFDHETPHVYHQRVLRNRPRVGKFNLQYACGELGIATDDVIAHRAAADVTLTHRLYEALVAQPVVRQVARAARL